MADLKNLPVKPFASQDAWAKWLDKNHAASDGLWLKIAKKASGIRSIDYAEALEVALCYGWIDGQKGSFDENYFLQKFTPRRARSKWSKVNRQKATALIESGAMKPAGLREVERAKADGRWEAAYDSPRTATVPEDLQRELDADPAAKRFFESLDRTNRYAILYRVQEAKRPETRARRIEKFVTMLREGKKIHP